MYSVKIGFIPTRRNISAEKFCNKDVAGGRKAVVEAMLKEKKVSYVNLDFLNEEGMLLNILDAEKVASKMIAEGVDALFFPHCNFGTEDAVAKVAKLVGKPVLLWGPRDDAPCTDDGQRMTDSQCGLFATGKILKQYGAPFTYITNSAVTDEVFVRGFDAFLAVASVVKSFTRMRVGQIGTRPTTFTSVRVNELELIEKFGIEVTPITMTELELLIKDTAKNNKSAVDEQVEAWRRDCVIDIDADSLTKTAVLKCALRRFADEQNLAALAVQCWEPMSIIAGVRPCFAFSDLTGEKLPTVCELDIHGAVSSVMAQAASNWTAPSFLADLTIRHPENDNAELFWHCGVFPKGLSKVEKPTIARSFDGNMPSVGSYEIKHTDYTITRFDAEHGNYSMVMGHAKGVDGPATMGTYGWLEFDNWPEWEHKFVYGPYIHHCTGIPGKLAPILYEACKYIPGLEPDPVNPTAAELQTYFR